MLRCNDDTFYTGITTDVERRLREHNSDRGGAKYTRYRRPVALTYVEHAESRSAASKREHNLRKLNPQQKRELISAISGSDEG